MRKLPNNSPYFARKQSDASYNIGAHKTLYLIATATRTGRFYTRTRDSGTNFERQIIEKAREFGVPTYMCFIDYAKAFDCVQWQNLWQILDEMGIPRHLILLIKNLHENNIAYVRVDKELTNPSFPVRERA